MFNATENIDVNQGLNTKLAPENQDFSGFTNDQFLNAVFGLKFTPVRPPVYETRDDIPQINTSPWQSCIAKKGAK
jgi:hypothetical protein